MITPMDIHNKTFSKGLRGYSEEEVNDFLRQIVTDYEQIYREHREMEEEMDQMKVKLSNYERISDTMTATLQLAKDTAENVKKNAKRNADILISNAKMEGDRQVKDAEDYRRRLRELGLGLEDRLTTKVGTLSGGQRQALTLLMATLQKPKLLLLDEHTAALDPQTAQRVMDITDRLVRENHLTTLMITHNMRDAIHYGNRLLMLHNGRIVLDISGEEKARLTVPDLLALFSKVSGQEYDNDRALLA